MAFMETPVVLEIDRMLAPSTSMWRIRDRRSWDRRFNGCHPPQVGLHRCSRRLRRTTPNSKDYFFPPGAVKGKKRRRSETRPDPAGKGSERGAGVPGGLSSRGRC